MRAAMHWCGQAIFCLPFFSAPVDPGEVSGCSARRPGFFENRASPGWFTKLFSGRIIEVKSRIVLPAQDATRDLPWGLRSGYSRVCRIGLLEWQVHPG